MAYRVTILDPMKRGLKADPAGPGGAPVLSYNP